MPWFVPHVPERVCKYLLQRYLGQFIEEKLTLDQLSVDLYQGTGTVEKVSLDVQALNELGEKQNWPLEFVDGYVDKLNIYVPWTSILKDSSFIEVQGLKLTLQPKQRKECATSMFESMWSSMTNSMQLAQECMKQDSLNSADVAQPLEGIEKFAQMIDSILSRVKVKFMDTVVQIEHVPQDSRTGVAVQIDIEKIEYLDEAGNDPPTGQPSDNPHEQNKAYVVSSFTTKNFLLEGVTFSTVEFPSKARTVSRSVISQSQSLYCDRADSLSTLVDGSSSSVDGEENSSGESIEVVDEQRHVIMFAKLCSKQEIRIRLKQSEIVAGPKVSFEVNLGSLILFLSPRQFHVLLELASGMASPDKEDTSNVAPRQKCAEKPMGDLDYQRIEQELQQQLHPLATLQAPGLQGTHGWSTAALDDSSDNDETFLPMRTTNAPTMYESTNSVASSSLESSFSSSITSSVSEQTFRGKRRTCNIDSDPLAEISHFQIRVASLAAVLLHEDILTISADQERSLVASSVRQMKHCAETFFEKLNWVSVFNLVSNEYEKSRSIFEEACKLNQLRFLAAGIQIEGKEATTLTAFSISGKLTIAKLEIIECLNDGNSSEVGYSSLVSFADNSNAQSPITANPNLKLVFKHVEKTAKSGGIRRTNAPKTDIIITLDPCTIELDITIVDRICAVLNPQPVCVITRPQNSIWGKPPPSSTNSQQEIRIDTKVVCSDLTLKLRFPIPDFRPPHDLHRIPWWKKHVRPDFLLLRLYSATGQTSIQSEQTSSHYTLDCRSLSVSYFESENSTPIIIAQACFDEKQASTLPDIFSCCRLSVRIHPVRHEEVELDQQPEKDVDMMSQSMYGAFSNTPKKETGPFSAKRVVHESDTPHTKPHQEDTDELIIPGDKEEIDKFVEDATNSARIQLEIQLPSISMQLASKHIYEVLYNRINSDLLLWEPSAPKPKLPENDVFGRMGGFPVEVQDTFTMCKSGIQYESESDSDDDGDLELTRFYSFSESKARQKLQLEPVKRQGQSYLSLSFHIGEGLLCMNPPARDVSTNVIPGQHGEFVLSVEDARISIVNGYRGDYDLGYVTVQAHNAVLYHCDLLSIPSQIPPLLQIGSTIGRHLHPLIYKSEPGILINASKKGGNREMITMAIKIKASHETHHVKTVRVAVGINKATLKHRMCTEPNDWISQLSDFFNVLDYPIPGYLAKDVLTELHLHLWDCAIDYRPLFLPLRSVVTMGNFSMSSHLSAQANTSTLTFIAEECALFLSEKAPAKSGIASTAPVDLKRDYVQVIDLGLFELSLRINDKKSNINPHIDLRASNDTVHIRTCADSARALTQLLTYYASDGDLMSSEMNETPVSAFSSPRHQPEQQLVNVEPQDVSNLSKSQHQQVNDLLGEAMKEIVSDEESQKFPADTNPGAKVFFFPDENLSSKDNIGKPLPQVTSELGDVTYRSNKSSDTDEEFCFLGDEAGIGIIPKHGIPEIRWLSSDPLRVIENHFAVPVGKADVLSAPKHFPTPVMRYTLCDMTVVWHMYGGSDFKPPENDEQKQKKTVNFADLQVKDGVGFSNSRTGEVVFMNMAQKKRQMIPWQIRGGVNRDHDVLMEFQLNKVRFQHEVYPETTEQASRQVLIISELEIRDRLASSQINKFLYQYTNQNRPKQSHANMVVIKALHIRPDPKIKTQECCLRISFMPLRLNVDQDSLLFLIGFFSELGGNSPSSTKEPSYQSNSKHNTPTHRPPIMTVSMDNEDTLTEQAQKIVDENLLILLEENKSLQEECAAVETKSNSSEESSPVYFRNVLFSPEVPIRLDYHGKRVDMTHGPLPGLLMGLAQLNCSELKLKRLSNRHGILGMDKLLTYFVQEWLDDIKSNQLSSLLSGVGPMHSLVQLMQGIKDLFWLPIEQYQKDGRIVRGIQRGANSFTTSTAMAALELTSRLIHLIQLTAETAYDMLSPGPSVRKIAKSKGRKKRYTQPQDIREGMANAYLLVKEGIGETADNIVRVASHEHEQKGYSGAVGGVLRQIPPTIFKPIIIASEATSNVLGGMRSQLVPDARREANQKWRSEDV